LNRRLNWSLVVAAIAIVSPGCGGNSGTAPEPAKPGATRDLVEHPLDALGKGKTPQKPVTAKVQGYLDKAKQADPRNR
jgi:hypothetical protein